MILKRYTLARVTAAFGIIWGYTCSFFRKLSKKATMRTTLPSKLEINYFLASRHLLPISVEDVIKLPIVGFPNQIGLCNSYTMGFSPVLGDNPRALASGLSYVQVDNHGITILYHD